MSWFWGQYTGSYPRRADADRRIEDEIRWPSSRTSGGDQSTAQAPISAADDYRSWEPGQTRFDPTTAQTQEAVETATSGTVAGAETQTVVEVATEWIVENQVAQVTVETLSYDASAETNIAQVVVETLSSVARYWNYAGTTDVEVDSTSTTAYVPVPSEQHWEYDGITDVEVDSTAVLGRVIVRDGITDVEVDPTSPVSRTRVPTTGTDVEVDTTSPTGTAFPNTWEPVTGTDIEVDTTGLTDNRVSVTAQTQVVVESASVVDATDVAAEETQTVVEAANSIDVSAQQTQLVVEVATHYYVDPCSDEFAPGADLCGKRDIVTWVTWDPGDGVRRLFTQVQIPDLER